MTEYEDTDTLEGLVQHAARFAREAFAKNEDPGYEFTPMFIGVSRTHRKSFAVLTPFVGATEDEVEQVKNMIVHVLKVHFALEDVSHYVMISEAWVATVDPRINPEFDKIQPSKRMDRREVVTIMGAEKGGKKIGRTLPIERGDDGVPRLGQGDIRKPDELRGRMTEILDVPEMPEELRPKARAILDAMGFLYHVDTVQSN